MSHTMYIIISITIAYRAARGGVASCVLVISIQYVDSVRPAHARIPCRTVIYTRENFGLMRESVTQDPSA